jgi:hypothetical protein
METPPNSAGVTEGPADDSTEESTTGMMEGSATNNSGDFKAHSVDDSTTNNSEEFAADSSNGHVEAVEPDVVELRPTDGPQNCTPLHEIRELLLQKGAKLEKNDKQGM